MQIVFNNAELAVVEPKMAEFAMQKALWYPEASNIIVWCNERVPEDAAPYKHPGWLEWGMSVTFEEGHKMHLALIQRTKDAGFEAHS